MYKSITPTVLALACFIPNAATADTFNTEIRLSLADNDSYSVSLAPGYRYYFSPVDDSTGPLEMAGFLNQASSIQVGFEQTDYPSSSSYNNVLSWSAYTDFVFQNGVNLGLGGVKEAWNYDASQNKPVLDASTTFIDIGYYLDQFGYINLGYEHMSSSEDQKMDTVTMMGLNLIPLSAGRHLKLKAEVSKSNHINSLWNNQSFELDTTYYPQHNLGLSAGIDYTLYNKQNNRVTYSLGTKYFFDTNLYAAINMDMVMQGSENWSNKQTINVGARF